MAGALTAPDGESFDPAVAALLAAARALPRQLRMQLVRALVRLVALEDAEPIGRRGRDGPAVRAVEALVDLAGELGRCPTTGDYTADYRERRRGGDLSRPSLNMIIRAFGSWKNALVAAGLADPARPNGITRRRGHVRLHVGHYPTERLLDSLRACARDLGRTPTVRDYSAWRIDLLGRRAVSHLRERDIPHWRTLYKRFGNWGAALKAAGLDPNHRPPGTGWSPLS